MFVMVESSATISWETEMTISAHQRRPPGDARLRARWRLAGWPAETHMPVRYPG